MSTRRKIKIRKSVRYFYLASAILILVCSSTNLLRVLLSKGNLRTKSQEIYSYTNKFNYSYNVNLINNPYIEKDTLDMNENVYVTDLIKSIDLNLNYKYIANEKSEIKYEYKVKGYIIGTYTKDGDVQKIWEKEYKLIDENEKMENTNTIDIKETIKLNLKEENNLVKQFEQEMSMNIDAKYVIKLEVSIQTNLDGQEIKNKYTSTINFDLAEKTTKVTGDNNKEDKKYISEQITEKVYYKTSSIILSIALDIISIAILRYVCRRTSPMNKIKNEYRQELNRILRLCQDKIVQVSTQIDIRNEKIIDVKDFGEIIKVSEELFKPILYWSAKDKEEAWFYVVSNNVTYRYILKNGENIK